MTGMRPRRPIVHVVRRSCQASRLTVRAVSSRLGHGPGRPFYQGLIQVAVCLYHDEDAFLTASQPTMVDSVLAADDAGGPVIQVDQERIRHAVREILLAVGEDPDREGLRETPARVARMYAELLSGMRVDPKIYLEKFFTEKYDEVVLVRDISFCSICEHHLLPFIGKAHVAYLPAGKVIGLSKLARVVETLSHRPQVQERMTEDIANLLTNELNARGVAVVLEATHTCMTIRGVRKPDSLCVTSAMKGVFRTNLSTRSEVMQLIYGQRR